MIDPPGVVRSNSECRVETAGARTMCAAMRWRCVANRPLYLRCPEIDRVTLHLGESGRASLCLDCPFAVRRSNLGGLHHGNGLVDVASVGPRTWLRRSVGLEESDG